MPVTDLERSTAWYRDTLGLEQIGEGAWPEFQLGENVLALPARPDEHRPGVPGAAHLVDRAARRRRRGRRARELEARGVEFRGETFDTGVCHMAFFSDPDGNELMLHRRYAPRD